MIEMAVRMKPNNARNIIIAYPPDGFVSILRTDILRIDPFTARGGTFRGGAVEDPRSANCAHSGSWEMAVDFLAVQAANESDRAILKNKLTRNPLAARDLYVRGKHAICVKFFSARRCGRQAQG